MKYDKAHKCRIVDKPEIKITADGSHTLYVPNLDETYHSVHGAIQEAMHVYINAGLNYFNDKKELAILEVGFGTGLNTFLTYREAIKKELNINYSAIEAYPLSIEEISKLNYLQELAADQFEMEVFDKIHKSKWEVSEPISNMFSLRKLNMLLQDFAENNQYDVIYFDAFGPMVQPELWEEVILKNMYNSLKSNGILVTYCAKGSVKRALKQVGFTVENIPGPPGKREMTRAIK
jgi:tRNA U34 5-methylaminomethyl-2-thiouridine-forming methyltransferase MnmC